MNEPVVFLTHEFEPFRGGAATYVREVVAAARRDGLDARVLAPDYRRHDLGWAWSPAADPVRLGEHDATSVQRFRGSGRLNPVGILEVAVGIWRRRDVLAGLPLVAGSAGVLMALILLDRAGLFRPGRLLSFLHGSEILKLRRRTFWRRLAPGFFARWPHVGVASRYVRELWEAAGDLSSVSGDQSTVYLAPCACAESFLEHLPKLPVRSASSADDDRELRVLTVARLHPRKGQVRVAQALGRLSPALRARVLYQVVGTGTNAYRVQLETTCMQSNVRLQLLGRVPDEALPALYSGADVYAQASTPLLESVEGFGITYLEAAACGLPVAAWASGGTSEAVLDGRTGLLAPEHDTNALAYVLTQLLSDPGLRARLGRAGMDRARSFRWETSARTLVQAARVAYPVR